MGPYKTTPIYASLNPYEVIRWRVSDRDGALLGYASRYHYDGRSHWRAWRADGLRQDVHNRARAILTLIENHR
jgi:hypothetical protein